MGCCGDREKQEYLRKEQRWEYINLDDFKSTSCWTPFAYGYLWVMLAVSLSVYAVDTFTCINLIAFDNWSGQIKPAIPLRIARWIFAGCIILSVVLLIYRWARAIRVMRQGGVAKNYLDPLAVRIQSIRMGKRGRGWKRFLIFAELTKSRKGADYVALFAYFSFEAWLRIVFAEGPRQVINAITLYSVMQAQLIPTGDHKGDNDTSPFIQFWKNVGYLADENKLQAVILFGMLWTLIIWILSAISLAVSVILYLVFLWHHIPSNDGGLTNYCRNKINRRMERIVKVKVDKALKKENELLSRQEARAAREGLSIKKQPTLPDISTSEPSLPTLSRQTTMTTLPEYESRPASVNESGETLPPLPTSFIDGRPQLRRHMTQASDASWSSYNSGAPLMSQPGDFGQSPIDRAQTPGSTTSGPWPGRPTPSRSATGFSQYSERSFTPGPRPPTANSMRNVPGSYQMEPLPRSGTSMSTTSYKQTPVSATPYPDSASASYFPAMTGPGNSSAPFGPPSRSQTFQDPPTRSFTPAQTPVDRSMASSVPPQSFVPYGARSNTPMGGPPDRTMNHSVPPPDRSFTPSGPPPNRQHNSAVPLAERSYTPTGPAPYRPNETRPPQFRPYTPSRSVTEGSQHASGPSSDRSIPSAYQEPTLPAINPVDDEGTKGYAAFQPGTTATLPDVRNIPPQLNDEPPRHRQFRSFSRPLGPGQRNSDVNRDSGVEDIISHY